MDKDFDRPVRSICEMIIALLGRTEDRKNKDRLNKQIKNIDQLNEQLLEAMKKLDDIAECTMEERYAKLEFCEVWMDLIFLLFMFDVVNRAVYPEENQNPFYEYVCRNLPILFFGKYEKVWIECSRRDASPFKDKNFYNFFLAIMTTYSWAKKDMIPASKKIITEMILNFIQDMVKIYSKKFLGQCLTTRREKIVEFDWTCDLAFLYILLYETSLDEGTNGFFKGNEENNLHIKECIESCILQLRKDYTVYKDFLPTINIIKCFMVESYNIWFHDMVSGQA